MTIPEAEGKIRETFAGAVLDRNEFRGELSLEVAASSIRAVSLFCRDTLGFNYLLDITSIDQFDTEPRWEIVYELYSMERSQHLRLRIRMNEDVCEADTVSDIWATADWHEREIYDMMGIRFRNHPDLRRILMWDGYPYFPLRKDFPLEGKPSDVPDVAFTEVAPLAGGPFVTSPTTGNTQVREPRARHAGELPVSEKFIAEP
ncbi:MAG: NADH-quinone oxidoreductase subunit C [Chthoniobacterales bacterium]